MLCLRDLAQSPGATPEILTACSYSPDNLTRFFAAKHPAAWPETIARLAGDRCHYVQAAAKRNPGISLRVLMRFTESEDIRYLAQNPNLPPEWFTRLTRNPDRSIRFCLAKNRRLPLDALARLSEDEDAGVRAAIAAHPGAPSEILAQLAEDEDEYVRYGIIVNPRAPRDLLAVLAEDVNRDVREAALETLAGRPVPCRRQRCFQIR